MHPTPPCPASSPLELRVFGVPVAVVHGRETRIPLKRAAALLAYLAFSTGPVPRTDLAAMLWPDADETRARTRLRRLAYQLDDILGGGILLSGGDCLALVGQAVETDALRFAGFARAAVAAATLDDDTLIQARQWVECARRPLMQGIAFGSEVFDDWLDAESIEHEHLLARLLERISEALGERGEFASALEFADALVALDVYREPSYVLLMQLHACQGHRAGVEAAFTRCAEALRAEFGIRPGPTTEQAYLRMMEDLGRPSPGRIGRMERPDVRFADGGLGTIAYTTLGAGEQTLVIAPGFVCHIEIALENPVLCALLDALADQVRVILFDRRGVGLSERLRATSTPAALADDIVAILDHAGVSQAWVFGSSEGGLGAMRLAIDHPHRVRGLCLFGSLARGSAAPDYP